MKKFDYRWKVARHILDHFRRSYASPCHARSYQGVRPMTYYYVLLVRTIVLSRASALDRPKLWDLPLVLPLVPTILPLLLYNGTYPYYYVAHCVRKLPTPSPIYYIIVLCSWC